MITVIKKIIPKLKYPVVKQYDMIDCGPAALLSVLRFYGGNTTLVKMRDLCRTTTYGSTMLDLVNAAKQIGFNASGAKGEYADLLKEKMPCIAHVVTESKFQHFVVVYKINEKGVYLGDPGKGLYNLSREKFNELWKSRSVILLKPQDNLLKENDPNWLSWVATYLKKEESWIYQSLFLGVVYTFIGLLISLFVQWIIDRFIPGKEYYKIIYTGFFLLALLIIKAAAGYIRRRFLVILNKRVNININADFISHLFNLPKKFFDTRKTGDITARINDAVRIQQAILTVTTSTIIDLFIITGALLFMFQFSVPLALIALITLPFYMAILVLYTKKIKDEQNEVMKGYAGVEATYIDSIGGIDEILGFNSSPQFAGLNRMFFKNFQDKIESLGFTQALLSLSSELAGAVISIGLLIVGAVMVIDGKLMLGQMMAAYSLLAYLLPSVNRLADANISLQGASIASQRLMDMFLVEKEKDTGNKRFELNDKLSIAGGSFSWNGRNYLFSDLNIDLNKGRITALWGRSGAGKSTLVQIIQRKYPLTRGNIFIDGINADEIELEAYRSGIGVVPQSIKIFNGTIADNIMVGRQLKTINDLDDRINALGLRHFYTRFENGFFTLLGEDNRKLSGGEKQIIALTRAVWEEPEVLILDESLSGIDVELEILLHKVLYNYSRQHSVLIITHNIRTILRTDFVYLLDNGRIIQQGTPAELLSEKGYFRNLYDLNEQLYIKQEETVDG